ncbi:MAG: hypothetical protein JNM76_17910 [Betaproteobacteria bacterium]|nr:hypothetical protein [Betaproteobacteria bacterium]
MSNPPDFPDQPVDAGKTRRDILSGDREALVAIDTVIATAKRTLLVFDIGLKVRGYNSPQRCEVLRKFLLSSRDNRIRIALHEPRGLEADCPRLLNLMQQFQSGIRIHQTMGVACSAEDPFVIADDAAYWHKLHYQHPRSVLVMHDLQDTLALTERFNEIWESSAPAQVGGATGL